MNDRIRGTEIRLRVSINRDILGNVEECDYLDHIMKIEKDNQTVEIARRIALTWAAFGNLRHIPENPDKPKSVGHRNEGQRRYGSDFKKQMALDGTRSQRQRRMEQQGHAVETKENLKECRAPTDEMT
ncbi:hypothetical protein JTB14_000917 [Gonioctena quinquepunctata]|nr:hypothetical protein JTB14_000917 [Gonioctena quinquepunctata]